MVSLKQFSKIPFIKLLKFSTEILNLDTSRVLTCIEPTIPRSGRHGRQSMPLKSMLCLYCMPLPWPGKEHSPGEHVSGPGEAVLAAGSG